MIAALQLRGARGCVRPEMKICEISTTLQHSRLGPQLFSSAHRPQASATQHGPDCDAARAVRALVLDTT